MTIYANHEKIEALQKGDLITMKATGIVRKVDHLGRIVLPAELRKVLDINANDPLEIFTEDDMIIFKKYDPSCIFCSEARDVKDYMSKKICSKCFEEMKG